MMMTVNPNVRVRMAPSPTGYLHIGGARTALFNYLFARHNQGTFILRIEDTDRERSKKEHEEAILKDLKWIGIDWDEGPLKGGNHGPYYQSQRLDLYAKHLKTLKEKDRTYFCFCTPDELKAERADLLKRHKTPRYMGKCRNLSQEQISQFQKEGRQPVIRFKIEESKVVEFNDLVRGKVQVDPKNLGDFVIAKGDGMPLYNFASVVDDCEMKISHVIRGEEHISNTPRQLILLKLLDLPAPQYAHVSVILAPDRSKLSKRHGATSLGEYEKQGFLADALFNYLALLGWNPGDEREVMSRQELIKEFSLKRLIKSGAIFDVQKLSWMNGVYIRNKPVDEITNHLKPFLEASGLDIKDKSQEWLYQVINNVRGNLERLDQVAEYADIFFDEKFNLEQDALKHLNENKESALEVLKSLDALLAKATKIDDDGFKTLQSDLKKAVSAKGKVLFWTQRAALTGRLKGPEMALVFTTLSPQSCRKRIEKTLSHLQ